MERSDFKNLSARLLMHFKQPAKENVIEKMTSTDKCIAFDIEPSFLQGLRIKQSRRERNGTRPTKIIKSRANLIRSDFFGRVENRGAKMLLQSTRHQKLCFDVSVGARQRNGHNAMKIEMIMIRLGTAHDDG
jgi:hypothetical protein